MLFISIDFAIFLPIVFILYWFGVYKNLRLQNILLVIASYIFYGWWDWRFLSLIFFSTVVDYFVGRRLGIEADTKRRKLLLWVSIIVNIGLLGFFKYSNFFIENFSSAFTFLGSNIEVRTLKIILPVGISFYTFQTLSYTIDVYRRKLEPTKDFIAFSAFVSFFPQLVAGPIERAANLLPQFNVKKTFSYPMAVDGLRQILWGLFKKIVIADNCAEFADYIFSNSGSYSGFTLVLGVVFFAFQIYGDFSGYSDIAIGTAKLFGFNLRQNFAFPYFSRDIAEFWRRWHISLSSWFRDYLYIPLGGSRGSTLNQVRNTFIIFIVSGFWHGANWTFIAWGAVNALYFLPLLLTQNNRKNIDIVARGRFLPSLRDFFAMALTFLLTNIAWVFFRAESIEHAIHYFKGIFRLPFVSVNELNDLKGGLTMGVILLIFVLIEWWGRDGLYPLSKIDLKMKRVYRYVFYYVLVLIIFFFGGKEQEFIYFQF